MKENSPISEEQYLHPNNSLSSAASKSLTDLINSLSQEQIVNQDLLLSLSFALRSFTNVQRFLELIPLLVTQLVGVKGSLLIPFQDNGSLWCEQLQILPVNEDQELFRKLFLLEEGKKTGFGMQERNIAMLDRIVQRHFDSANVIATSIVSRGRQRGRLYAFDKKEIVFGSNVHRKHIQIVADLTGIAIENDAMFQVIRNHEKVDRQISIGAEIQSQLLPDECPIIEGVELAARCRPAFQVGGDYYDFMPTRPDLTETAKASGRWAFVIGDVMGKGVPAGLLMTMLRGMLRAEVLTGLAPDSILHDLNQLALEDLTQSHRFVTLFYSDYDARSRKLRFANAAHNPPLLWRAQSKSINRLDSPGLLIGLQPEAVYGCGEIVLEPGDVLLYYTDGVTEAPGISGERFDENRLITFLDKFSKEGLGAQQILNKLFERLDGFVSVNEHHLEDDASMVVLKVSEESTLPELT
ncbi:PP2C family protein-serine/threonine phosphatase [Prochlorococcus marinus]|uniref:PP2C family protein-serine/threonine phosphatase n=1 Tax=Prochlorococcus marinus TaxID=1219 RepID=UPI0022B2B934|nr:PP2C family protein-serine/threonine phosphatase [Prochlorococcus marinus]